MPGTPHVVVIGAGSIGVNSAYALAGHGARVTLLDREDVCAGSSWGNAGLIVPSHSMPLSSPGVIGQALRWMLNPESPFYIKPRLSPALWSWLWRFRAACNEGHLKRGSVALRDLSVKSLEMYNAFDDAGDLDFSYERKGIVFLYATDAGYRHGAYEADFLRGLGLGAEVLDKPAVTKKLGDTATPAIGGVFFPGDAHLVPGDFVTGLARKAQAKGVDIKTHAEVHGFQRKGRRISAVLTNTGAIEADEVVLAAGSWSPGVAKSLGLRLPIQPAKGYSVSYEKPSNAPPLPLMLAEARTGVTPMGTMLRLGGTLELVGMDLSINQRRVSALLRAAKHYLPGINFDALRVIRTWAGLRPATPDGLPLIGRPKTFDNLTIAAGHATVGISTGPGTGVLVAQTVLGEEPFMDTRLFDPNRFG